MYFTAGFGRQVEMLRRYDRPMLCTEYMARGMGSTFESILPYLLKEGIGAYNWGITLSSFSPTNSLKKRICRLSCSANNCWPVGVKSGFCSR